MMNKRVSKTERLDFDHKDVQDDDGNGDRNIFGIISLYTPLKGPRVSISFSIFFSI